MKNGDIIYWHPHIVYSCKFKTTDENHDPQISEVYCLCCLQRSKSQESFIRASQTSEAERASETRRQYPVYSLIKLQMFFMCEENEQKLPCTPLRCFIY